MRNFLMAVLFLFSASVFAQPQENLSYNDLMAHCEKGTRQKMIYTESAEVRGAKGNKANAKLHCWMEEDKRFAVSELWVEGQKVYETPAAALREFCGNAAGEIFRLVQWSPDGKYLAWQLIPFCWATEPFSPVVMLYDAKTKKSSTPKFDGIAAEFYKRYPKAKEFKQDIQLEAKPLRWDSAKKLLLELEVICYGCPTPFPKTVWSVTPEGKTSFVGEN